MPRGEGNRAVAGGAGQPPTEDELAAHAVPVGQARARRGQAQDEPEVVQHVAVARGMPAGAARAPVTSQVEGQEDKAGYGESAGDVMIAAGMLPMPVGQAHRAARLTGGIPAIPRQGDATGGGAAGGPA